MPSGVIDEGFPQEPDSNLPAWQEMVSNPWMILTAIAMDDGELISDLFFVADATTGVNAVL